MNYELEIVPTYSEHGHVVTVIVRASDGGFITQDQLADALREYADLLNDSPAPNKN